MFSPNKMFPCANAYAAQCQESLQAAAAENRPIFHLAKAPPPLAAPPTPPPWLQLQRQVIMQSTNNIHLLQCVDPKCQAKDWDPILSFSHNDCPHHSQNRVTTHCSAEFPDASRGCVWLLRAQRLDVRCNQLHGLPPSVVESRHELELERIVTARAFCNLQVNWESWRQWLREGRLFRECGESLEEEELQLDWSAFVQDRTSFLYSFVHHTDSFITSPIWNLQCHSTETHVWNLSKHLHHAKSGSTFTWEHKFLKSIIKQNKSHQIRSINPLWYITYPPQEKKKNSGL